MSDALQRGKIGVKIHNAKLKCRKIGKIWSKPVKNSIEMSCSIFLLTEMDGTIPPPKTIRTVAHDPHQSDRDLKGLAPPFQTERRAGSTAGTACLVFWGKKVNTKTFEPELVEKSETNV